MSVAPWTRRGFTLVELLVVIVIIAVLLALLLPALQKAREASRAATCQSHIKQIALAVLQYEGVNKIFPNGETFDFNEEVSTSNKYRQNWLISILPFVEQKNLLNQFDLTVPLNVDRGTNTPTSQSNFAARAQLIETYLCPTDTGSDEPFVDSNGKWARGNYAANATNALNRTLPDWGGTPFHHYTAHCGISGATPQKPIDALGWARGDNRGVMGACVAVKMADIIDGTAKTMMCAEVRIGLNQDDRRGVWAMGTAGASMLFAHAQGNDANGPNPCNRDADDIQGCATVTNNVSVARLALECMQCHAGADYGMEAAPRSRHPGGLFTAACDGSVHFVSPLCAGGINDYTPETYSAWDRYVLSADHLTLNVSTELIP